MEQLSAGAVEVGVASIAIGDADSSAEAEVAIVVIESAKAGTVNAGSDKSSSEKSIFARCQSVRI